MTKKEAIEILNMDVADESLAAQAQKMAVEALKREAEREERIPSKKYRLSLSVWIDDGIGEYELRDQRRGVESRLPFPYLDTPRDVEEQLIEDMCKAVVQIQPTIFWNPKERYKDGG